MSKSAEAAEMIENWEKRRESLGNASLTSEELQKLKESEPLKVAAIALLRERGAVQILVEQLQRKTKTGLGLLLLSSLRVVMHKLVSRDGTLSFEAFPVDTRQQQSAAILLSDALRQSDEGAVSAPSGSGGISCLRDLAFQAKDVDIEVSTVQL